VSRRVTHSLVVRQSSDSLLHGLDERVVQRLLRLHSFDQFLDSLDFAVHLQYCDAIKGAIGERADDPRDVKVNHTASCSSQEQVSRLILEHTPKQKVN
jgi:hypothetical protein